MTLAKNLLINLSNTLTKDDSGIEDFGGKAGNLRSVVKIPGDASTRKYYRLYTDKSTFILMKLDPEDASSVGSHFIAIRNHLADCEVDVPAVLEHDLESGFILLEDLGDATLLKRLQTVSDMNVERHLYEKVIDDLVSMHFFASKETQNRKIPTFKLFFDYEKLMWEVNFTIEHFYDKHLRREMSVADRKALVEGFGTICTTLSNEPVVFTHRDFHSRNIMATTGPEGDRLVMIDFQDARMGPKQYDLASLLRDSYYQLEEAQIERLIDYYMARWEAVSGEKLDRAHFIRMFDLMSVQRNFKAIGSFASFNNRRGNPTYLKYIGNTFENIRKTLLRYPEFSTLREVLFHYYYF